MRTITVHHVQVRQVSALI